MSTLETFYLYVLSLKCFWFRHSNKSYGYCYIKILSLFFFLSQHEIWKSHLHHSFLPANQGPLFSCPKCPCPSALSMWLYVLCRSLNAELAGCRAPAAPRLWGWAGGVSSGLLSAGLLQRVPEGRWRKSRGLCLMAFPQRMAGPTQLRRASQLETKASSPRRSQQGPERSPRRTEFTVIFFSRLLLLRIIDTCVIKGNPTHWVGLVLVLLYVLKALGMRIETASASQLLTGRPSHLPACAGLAAANVVWKQPPKIPSPGCALPRPHSSPCVSWLNDLVTYLDVK